MLNLDLSLPSIARRRRAAGFPPPRPTVFPPTAFAYWEGLGQSNMTGFNQVADAPATLRVVNPGIEMMTNEPGWRPYILLDDGESAVFVSARPMTAGLTRLKSPRRGRRRTADRPA